MCLGLILLALCQVPHSVNVLSSACGARTSTNGCSFNGSRCSQSLLKVLNTMYYSCSIFLFGNCLIYRFTPYFFDSQTFFFIKAAFQWFTVYVCGSSEALNRVGSVTCCSRKLFLKQDKNLPSSLPPATDFQSILP